MWLGGVAAFREAPPADGGQWRLARASFYHYHYAATTSDSIHLVREDDAWLVVLGVTYYYHYHDHANIT